METLNNITGIEDTIKEARLQQFVKKRSEVTLQLVEDWLQHPNSDPKPPLTVSSSVWPNQEESLKTIHTFLARRSFDLTAQVDKTPALNARLSAKTTQRSVSFRLVRSADRVTRQADFMDAILTGPTRNEIKSSVF